MSDQKPLPLVGRIALQLRMVTQEQLAELTRVQAKEGDTGGLGELMVARGLIDRDQLKRLLDTQKQVVAKARARQAIERADAEPEVATAPVPKPGAKAGAPRAEGKALPPAAPRTAKPGAPAAAAKSAGPAAAPAAAAASKPAAAPARAAAPLSDSVTLVELLREGVERRASDIHIHAGLPLRFRLHGRFVARDDAPLAKERTEQLVLAALDPAQRAQLDERGQLDFAMAVPGLGRFRANAFRQQNGYDAVFRHVPIEAPSLEDLGLPTALAKFTNYHQGMVLLTGPANCGKSSTLAALVRILNEERRDHILTIEDPIEYVHESKRCVVNQRGVGGHTESFARALRAALREDPDVIVIGELRDYETVSLALTAAETGHLVLGTLHTNGAVRTINRIVGVFPADQQEQVRSMVSESLRAVVSQRLVTNADETARVPALEILVVNKAIANLIRENKTFQIPSQIQMGASQGMIGMDDSLNRLVKENAITKEEALKHAEDPKRITG
ncbi:MAG TPA: type IV pilus twitching motility protein PilT [Myxococcota bacterium]|nr:type IV pilus twitching motility protein PilT [Myxococcota bacterium]